MVVVENLSLQDPDGLLKHGIKVQHRVVDVSESMRMALTEGFSERPVSIVNCFENPAPLVGFNFCLQGSTSFALTRGYPTAFANPNFANTFVMPACSVRQELSFQNSLSLATFYIEAGTFLKIIGESAEALPGHFIDTVSGDNRCYFEKHAWQPVIRAILSQVFNSRFSPNTQRIFIEAKAMELIAIILELYTKGNPRQFTISKSDVERIQHARELLIRDLARPPSLSQLARMAGTNEFTLKKGFKEIFDVPVFKHLQQMRLAKAYDLFQSTNLGVNEVASLVGYESMSSFLRVFSETYGMNPKDVRRIPFRTL